MLEQSRIEQQFSVFERIRPWMIAFTGTLYMLYEFMQIHLPNSISVELMRQYALDAEQLGWLSSAYFYANFLLLLPAGLLLDRISVKKLIIFGMICTIVGPLVFALFLPFEMLVVGRAITGIGGAFSFIGCVKLASLWISPRNMGMLVGLVALMAMLGGVIAQTPTTLMIEYTGLRHTLFIHVIIGILITGIIALVISDKSAPFRIESTHIMHWIIIGSQVKQLLTNPQNWWAALYTGAMNQPMFLLGGLWGILYLEQGYGLSAMQASWITTLLFIGTVIGNPTIGWLSDAIKSRRLPMRLAVTLATACMVILLFVPGLTYTSLLVVFFLLGIAHGGQVLGYTLVAEVNPREMTATACSLVSICTIGSIAVTQPLFGWLLNVNWSGTRINDVPLYTMGDYNLAFNIFVVAVVIMIAAAIYAKETHCKHVQDLR